MMGRILKKKRKEKKIAGTLPASESMPFIYKGYRDEKST